MNVFSTLYPGYPTQSLPLPPLRISLLLPQDEAVVIEGALAARQDVHVEVPQRVGVEQRAHEVRLAVGDVQEDAVVAQGAVDLAEVAGRVVADVGRRRPGAAVDHGVHGALVEGDVDGARRRGVGHVAHVGAAPLDAARGGVPRGHELDDDGGEVEAQLRSFQNSGVARASASLRSAIVTAGCVAAR
ncbi:hypothetical protein Ct61P_13282 [Colletotrichum tofieldiae]|nr:hypothetical protein Ct61P_13282 [Colletotrichum tofieldiae]